MTDSTDVKIDLTAPEIRAAIDEAIAAAMAPLKAKNEELLSETKAAKAARREADDKAKAEADDNARKGGDVAALEKSWAEKLAKRDAELSDLLKASNSQLVELTVNATAQRLAAELSVPGSAAVLLPHIKARLSYTDGKLYVLDSEGKPSASTVEELAKEIAANKAFAPLIVASHATGGGASGAKAGGGAAGKSITRGDFNKLDPYAQAAHFKNSGTVND